VNLDDYLKELSDLSIPLKASGLIRLSGLMGGEERQVGGAWEQTEVQRRRQIVQALIDLEEDNVELNFDAVFFRGLEDGDAEVRLQSIRGLWEHEAPDLIAPLLQLLTSDASPLVRAEAALALGRYVALWEAGRLRDRYFRNVESGLRAAWMKRGEIEEVRSRVLEAIGAHHDEWVRQAANEAYESGSRRLKVSAIQAMGRSCDPRWMPLVLRELSNDEAEVRYEAAVACGSLGDKGVVAGLVPLLSDSDAEVRHAAVLALGEIGSLQARDALTELAAGGPEDMRDAAKDALASIQFEEDPLSVRYSV